MAVEKRAAELPEKKVGLALGSGAARGLAHIGVLAVLEKEGIPIDMIAGTSAGAAIGAIYARGKTSAEIEKLVLEITSKRIASFIDPSLPKTGFIKGNKFKELLTSVIGNNLKFSDLIIPFACVATDINTGEEVIFDSGSVTEAVRASISIPAIFSAVKSGGRYLVDGALVNPVPVSVLKKMGAGFIIAVNVIPDATARAHHFNKDRTTILKEPNLIYILAQSTYIGAYSLVKSSLEDADIFIEPQVAHIGSGDFHHVCECILQGKLAAQASIPEIKKQLEL
ncbi:patatin-like phospholipase family protein [Chloroflexota bacterium]